MNERHKAIHESHKKYEEAEHAMRQAAANGEDITSRMEALKAAADAKRAALQMPDNRKCIFCKKEDVWENREFVVLTLAGITYHATVKDAETGEDVGRIRAKELAPNDRPAVHSCKKCLKAKGLDYLIT